MNEITLPYQHRYLYGKEIRNYLPSPISSKLWFEGLRCSSYILNGKLLVFPELSEVINTSLRRPEMDYVYSKHIMNM